MQDCLIRNSNGFAIGYTPITQIGELINDTGINFGILKLQLGQRIDASSNLESAYLLISGKCTVIYDNTIVILERQSCFDEEPVAIHFSANNSMEIEAISDCEFAVSQVKNAANFSTVIFTSNNLLESEKRGKGLLGDTSCRVVRTIFDIRNRPESKLVLGEVITAPGRWSSYPPHHHQQPEIYHYRFTENQGYGHAECGENVFKVKHYDTYKIAAQHDHAQVAAPGYGMYYIWVIRHLVDQPYLTPDFTEAHSWTKDKDANSRVWKCDF